MQLADCQSVDRLAHVTCSLTHSLTSTISPISLSSLLALRTRLLSMWLSHGRAHLALRSVRPFVCLSVCVSVRGVRNYQELERKPSYNTFGRNIPTTPVTGDAVFSSKIKGQGHAKLSYKYSSQLHNESLQSS